MNISDSISIQASINHKVVFLGNSGVGKTALIQRMVSGVFDCRTQSTVGLDSLRKDILHNGIKRRLQIWDTAGQEKYFSLIPSYVRDNDCAIIVFDLTDQASLDQCGVWKEALQDSQYSHCILVGNKKDLGRKVNGFDFALKHSMTYLEVSAKTGEGIENIMEEVISGIDSKNEKETFDSEKSKEGSASSINEGQKEAKSDRLEINEGEGKLRFSKKKSVTLKQLPKNSCCSI